jgi:hypothetical protein
MAGTNAIAKTNGHRPRTSVRELRQDNAALEASYELVTERLAELELALDARDWIELGERANREFSREGLRRICYLARIHYIKNPLIKRAIEVMRYYVWAQGVSVSARHPGINDVVQQFWDDPKNRAELTSHQARGLKEVDLGTEGNIIFTLFRSDITGKVRVRTIPFDEIEEVVKNPEDRKDPWYYKRVWTKVTVDVVSGRRAEETVTDYYPALSYDPVTQPAQIASKPVHWDTRVLHLRVGGTSDMTFGVPEVYAAIDWAKAVKTDLEDFATLRKALARFAWNLTVKGGAKGISSAKSRLQTTIATGDPEGERNPPPVAGSTWIAAEGAANLQPMRTAGATPSPDDARRLGLMVAAAVGLPETILFGDADVGNLATSKTLDRPTELKVVDRQELWSDTLRTLLDYAVRATLKASSPAVDIGGVDLLPDEDPEKDMLPHETVVVTDVDDAGEFYTADVTVDFPPVLEHDPEMAVRALVSAATLDGKQPAGTIPRKEIARQAMTILHVENIDAMLEQLWPEGSDENAAPVGYEPPAPVSPFGAFTPGGGAGPASKPEDPGAFAAALREFRQTIAPVLERWKAEYPDDGAYSARLEEHMRKAAETIAASIHVKEAQVAVTEDARAQLMARIGSALRDLAEATTAVATAPVEDARIPALESALARAREADTEELRRLRAQVEAIVPVVNVHPSTAPEPQILFAPQITVKPAEAAAPTPIEVHPAPVTVVVRHPRKTRTRVSESDKDGSPLESITEVVEE